MRVDFKKISFFRIFFLGFVCAMFLGGCGYFGGSKTATQDAPSNKAKLGKPTKPKFKIPVTVEKVKRGRMYAYLEAVGTVNPVKELEIKPETTERVYFAKRWKEGDEVKKGTIFASMDDRQTRMSINDAELNLQLAKARVDPASAQMMQSYKDEQFKKAMFDRGAISKADYDLAILTRIQRVNTYEETVKNIDSRKMALDKVKQEVEKINIIIPFDGVLLPVGTTTVGDKKGQEADLTTVNGQMVGASTVLCRLANIDEIFVSLDVPAKDLLEIKVGQDVEIDIYSRLGKDYRGKVTEISTSLNSNTRTYTVNVRVPNKEHELRPGMFAKAKIITKEKLDALSIPRDLVILKNNKNVVYVAVEKPQDEVESSTTEMKIPGTPDKKENPQVVKPSGNPKVAIADEAVAEATSSDPTPADVDITDSTSAEDSIEDPSGELTADAAKSTSQPEKSMIANERELTLGIENRELVEVTGGLKEGDLLVVLGYETLSEKVDVNITYRDKVKSGIQMLSK